MALSESTDGVQRAAKSFDFHFLLQLALRGPAGPMGLTGRPGPMVSKWPHARDKTDVWKLPLYWAPGIYECPGSQKGLHMCTC